MAGVRGASHWPATLAFACPPHPAQVRQKVRIVSREAEAAVAGGRGGGTGKMDEEQKNKMARTPGTGSRLRQLPGSKPGPRASARPHHHCQLVSGAKEVYAGYESWHHGKEQADGKEL